MTINELIEKLKKVDGNKTVVFHTEYDNEEFDCSWIEENQDDVILFLK